MDEFVSVSSLWAMRMKLKSVAEVGATTIRVHEVGMSTSTQQLLENLDKNVSNVLTHARACGKLIETSRKGLDSE